MRKYIIAVLCFLGMCIFMVNSNEVDQLKEDAPPVTLSADAIAINESVESGELSGFNNLTGGIENAKLDKACVLKLYEQHSATFLSRLDHKASDFQHNFKNMLDAIRTNNISAQDICFHKMYFLSCNIINPTEAACKCAKENVWKHFRYVQEGQMCLIGKGGRCHPTVKNTLVCSGNLTCMKTEKTFASGLPMYVCPGTRTTPTRLLVAALIVVRLYFM